MEYTDADDGGEDKIASVRAVVAWFVDDLRGLAGPSGGFYAPAVRGSCLQCKEDAVQIKAVDVTVWPAACTHTPKDSEQRKAFKKWYLKNPAIASHGDADQAAPMTKAFSHRASLNCMRACAAAPNETQRRAVQQQAYWREVDIWSELLPYWDRVVQNLNDPAHEVYNIVKSLISTIGNLGTHKLSAKRRAFCRGLDQTAKETRAP